MATKIKSAQILDGAIVAADLHSAIAINTTQSGTFGTLNSNGLLTVVGGDILINDGSNDNERSVRLQNSSVTALLGIEGSSANRFIGSTANNMFLGTTTADGIQFATNNTVRATIDSSGDAVFSGDLTVTGDLTVEGAQVSLNTTALDVEDKNITLNYHASNDTSASADGAGITIQDAVNSTTDATILWDATNDKFDFSHSIAVTNTNPVLTLQDTDATNTYNRTEFQNSGGGLNLNTRHSDGTFVSTDYQIGKNATGAVEHKWFIGATARSRITSSGDAEWYENNGGTPQVGMHWDYADGRLGIGSSSICTNPQWELVVGSGATGATNGQIFVDATIDGTGDGLTIDGDGRSAGDGALFLIIDKDNSVGVEVGTTGNVSIGTGAGSTAKLHVKNGNSSQTYSNVSGVLIDVNGNSNSYYGLRVGSSSGDDHLAVTNAGNVGIGTDSPGAILDVNDDGVTDNAWNTLAKFRPDLSDPNAEASIHIQSYPSTTVVADRKAGIQSIDDAGDARSLILNKDGGSVGIGTDSTAATLDIDAHDSSQPSIKLRGSNVLTGGGTPEFSNVSGFGLQLSTYKFGIAVNSGTDTTTGMIIDQYGKVGFGGNPSAFLDVRKDNNNVGDQFRVADTEGTTAGIRTYSTSNGTGIILNHYYARSGGGNKYLRHGDIVSSMADGAASDFRFFTKDRDQNPRVAMTLTATGAIHTGAQQVRHNLHPTLSLDFANSRTLDSRIQYARNGIATYFDKSGVMKYAQTNEPRIDHDPLTGECKGLLVEEKRTNFIPYPNEFGFGQWSLPGLNAFQNAGLAPDGTMSADLLIPDYSYTSRHFGYRGVTGAFLSNNTYTISCYFKAYGGFSETCKLGYRVDSDTQNGDNYGSGFSIDAGEPAGNGWYRHSLTIAVGANATFNFAEFILGDQNGYQPTSGTGVYMWGFSVEHAGTGSNTATFPTSFIPTNAKFKSRASTSATYTRSDGVITTAGQHQARYDHGLIDGIWRPKGLLLESAATNLCQNFYYPASTLRWNSNVQNATITPVTSELAPDGSYNNVVRFKETTNNAATTASVYKPIAGTASTQRTFSVYAKKKELKMLRLYFDGTTPLCGQVIYNLNLGTIHIAQNPSGTDAWGIEDAGNGWWRCWFSGTVTGGQSTYYVHIDSADDFGNTSHQNTVGNGFYLWGPQMEYGGAPTSYIYTDDSAVTRALDQCETSEAVREGDDVKIHDMSWYNPQESTIYGEATSISDNSDTGSNPALFGLTNGLSSNRYLIRRYANDVTGDSTKAGFTFRLQQTMPDGTSYNNDYFSPTSVGSPVALTDWDGPEIHKAAMSISPGSQLACADGNDSLMTQLTNMPAYTQPTMVQIGHAGSSDYWNGHIRKVAYYPIQLNISEMRALTETDT